MSTILALGFLALTANLGAATAKPADSVIPLGETKLRLEQAYNRLCAPPLDDPDFVLSDVSFHFVRRFTEYSGDVSGRMLGALEAAGPLLNQESPMIKALLAGFPALQQPDGHFGAAQDLSKSVNQQRDMPILWGNNRLLLALAERARMANDSAALEMAKRLGDYIIASRQYYGMKENFEKVGGQEASGFTTCYPSWIDGLVALGEVSKEPKYLDEARFIANLALLDTNFDKHHSHGRLVAYRGMLDLDRVSGTSEFTEPVREACKKISEQYLLPTGGVTELFGRDFPRDEGCSEADWIRVNFLLWQTTADTHYLDAAEQALRNHLYATQFANGAFGHHTFLPVRYGRQQYPGFRIEPYASDSYWCCSMHCTQVLADLVHWGVLFSDNGPLVTWLANARAKSPDGAYSLAAEQSGPGQWKISLEATGNVSTTLRLRIPGWAKGVMVDGQAVTADGGWASLPCTWTGNRVLDVQFAGAQTRLTGPYGAEAKMNAPVSVFWGPDMFCLPDGGVDADMLSADGVPVIMGFLGDKPEAKGLPVIIQQSNPNAFMMKLQKAWLVPMSKRPQGTCRFLFHVERLQTAASQSSAEIQESFSNPYAFVEFMFAFDGPYECFLNGKKMFGGNGTDESPRTAVLPAKGRNTIAVKVPASSGKPGVIGQVLLKDRNMVTNPTDWQLLASEKDVPADWLADISKGADKALKPVDKGGFGDEPWKHVPAHFASTGARWLWFDSAQTPVPPKWLVFRASFDIPKP